MPLSPTESWTLMGLVFSPFLLPLASWLVSRLRGYTLKTEPGTSLKAAGWTCLAEIKGRSWNTPSRPREDKHPLQDKLFWELAS